jgi:hypothetical protein
MKGIISRWRRSIRYAWWSAQLDWSSPSGRSARSELLRSRNLLIAGGAMAVLIAGARVAAGGSMGSLGAVSAEGQVSYVSRGEELKAFQPTPRELTPLTPGQRRVASFIHQQYQIAGEAAFELTTVAEDVGKTVGLDPMLLLAVMAVESRFNPIAESPTGAKGLMQIVPQIHARKVSQLGAGTDDVLQPWINVLVGAQILREYIDRAGSIDNGLQWYNGAANDESKAYASRVLTERDRLVRVLRAASGGKT